jgi:hypothetical protein
MGNRYLKLLQRYISHLYTSRTFNYVDLAAELNRTSEQNVVASGRSRRGDDGNRWSRPVRHEATRERRPIRAKRLTPCLCEALVSERRLNRGLKRGDLGFVGL